MQAEAGAPLQVLLADGGAARNQTLMQFQADILGVPLLCSPRAMCRRSVQRIWPG